MSRSRFSFVVAAVRRGASFPSTWLHECEQLQRYDDHERAIEYACVLDECGFDVRLVVLAPLSPLPLLVLDVAHDGHGFPRVTA